MIKRIADSHIHFWQPERLRYDWLVELPALNRAFLPQDLAQAAASVPLERIVFVQADCAPSDGLREVAWVSGLAKDEPRIQGIVAFALLEKTDAGVYLTELRRNPLVKGVRRLIQGEDISFATRPDFVRGVQLLADFDLSFDICVRHEQLEAVTEMVRQCPDVQFVVDHCGKPPIKAQALEPWATNLQRLAEHPNVTCKLSGLVTEADRESWTAADLQPFIDHALKTFGPERLMFGGDWPVSELATNYARWVKTVAEATHDLSDTEVDGIFFSNACVFYHLM